MEPDYSDVLEKHPIKHDADGREIWDLDLIVRQVLIQTMYDRDWSQEDAAAKLGLHQKTLSRFLGEGQGTSLKKLSLMSAGLETTPLRLLDSHPEVGRKRPAVRIARDKVYDRFRAIFTPQEQDELLTLIENIRNLGLYNVAVTTLKGIVNAAQIGRRRGAREARKKQGA